jgi:uncharacterized membrane protein
VSKSTEDEENYLKSIWPIEIIEFRINDNGIVGFDYNGPLEIKEVVVEDSYMKTFEEIQKTIREAKEYLQISDEMILLALVVFVIGLMIGIVLAFFVSNVVMVGCKRYFLENREHQTEVLKIFQNFQKDKFAPTVKVMFLRTLYIWGWSLLLWIPGIVKSYSYMLVPFILAENTELDRHRVFDLSRKMMHGHKWEAFVLNLSFVGWNLLGALSNGLVSTFYVNPYIEATYAEFYSALKAEAKMKGLFAAHELPGMGEPEII